MDSSMFKFKPIHASENTFQISPLIKWGCSGVKNQEMVPTVHILMRRLVTSRRNEQAHRYLHCLPKPLKRPVGMKGLSHSSIIFMPPPILMSNLLWKFWHSKTACDNWLSHFLYKIAASGGIRVPWTHFYFILFFLIFFFFIFYFYDW